MIWSVAYGGSLYVRSVNGPTASWFRGTQTTHKGHIRAGGVDKDVTFAEPEGNVTDELNAAYTAATPPASSTASESEGTFRDSQSDTQLTL